MPRNAESRRPSEATGSQMKSIAADVSSVNPGADKCVQPALTGVDKAIRNMDEPFKINAWAAITTLAGSGRIFEPAWALEDEFGLIPAHPNYCGALVRQAVQAGLIRRVYYAPSQRPSRNGGIVGHYCGAGSK